MAKAPRRALGPDDIRRRALRHVERYGTTVAHLRRLLLRWVDASIQAHGGDRAELVQSVEHVLASLRDMGALDDRRFAIARARSLHGRGRSLNRIRQLLAAKGVREDDIRHATSLLATGHDDPDLRSACHYVRTRRMGCFAERRADPRRALSRLARAGFSYEVARRVLAVEDPEQLMSWERSDDTRDAPDPHDPRPERLVLDRKVKDRG